MTKREFVCIVCPNGCLLKAEIEDGKSISIEGGLCPKGKNYVENELVNPQRTLSTSVRVDHGELPLVSVRVDGPISKKYLFRFMDEVKKLRVQAPVHVGQILLADLWGTGVNVIATKNIRRVS